MKKHNKSKNGRIVLRIILIVVASVIIGSSVYTINARIMLKDLLPMPFGIGTSVVLTGSMEPALSVNDLVIVRKSDTYQAGDIIIFQDGQSLVIHRIVETDGETLVTKGDANNTEDEPIKISQVKGKYVFAIPGIGAVIRLMKTGIFTIIMIIGIILLIILSRNSEVKEDQEDLEKIKEEIRRLKDAAGESNEHTEES